VVVPPAVALVWLGLRLLEQDRALAAQRTVERRDAALQAAAFSLEQALSEAQRWFAEEAPPDGIVRFTLSSQDLRAHPADRVAWVPAPPANSSSDNVGPTWQPVQRAFPRNTANPRAAEAESADRSPAT
jgi:hypothetical protein